MKNLYIRQLIRAFLMLTFAAVIFSCSEESIEPELVQEVNSTVSDPDIIKDQYIVLLSDKPAKKDSRAAVALAAISEEVGKMPGARVRGNFKHSVTGFAAKLLPEQVEKLRKDKRIISITADKYVDLESISDANTVSLQEYPVWGLDRTDQRAELLDRAYTYNTTGNGVTAYIMDSGIRYTHSEFGGRASLGIDLVREYPDEEFDKDDPNVEDGGDCSGHGTHVAGTVGGGTFGVAKEVNLISVRVFSCVGRTTWSRILLAVDWITLNAVKPAVVNMSLGDIYTTEADPVELAINNSIDEGITYAIAGGNSNTEVCGYTPARIPKAITAGASDIYNKRASFSNYGSCLDLYAPGVSITSAGIADDNATRISSGTSMAAPHVAGIVALYLEKNPEATPAQIHTAIVENSTPGFITDVPSGPTNIAYSLWEEVIFNPPPAPVIDIKGFLSKVRGEYAINIQWTTPEEKSHIVYRDGIPVARFDNSENSYLEYTSLKNATFIYKVCGVSYVNCSKELIVVIGNGGDTSTEPTNSPPTADFNYTTNLLNVQFTDNSTDSDGSITNWNWDFGDGNSSNLQNPGHVYSAPGSYTVSLTVTDDIGDTANTSKTVAVTAEDPVAGDITLTATGYKVKGKWQTDLSWSPGGISAKVDIYRDGNFLQSIDNIGNYTDVTNFNGSGSLTYKVCEAGTITCSNEVTVMF